MKYDAVIVDVSLLAYRSWWHLRDLTTSQGKPTGLEYGTIKNLLTAAREVLPSALFLAWDGQPKRCLDLFPVETDAKGVTTGYKWNRSSVASDERQAEPSWGPRFIMMREVLSHLIPCLHDPLTEADEQIARFVYQQESLGRTTLIVSKDQDLNQLVSEKTHIRDTPSTESTHDEKVICEKWGVPPHKIPFFRALESDSSDCITGVKNIQKKVKIYLAEKSETIDDMISLIEKGVGMATPLQREKLLQGKDIIRRNYYLAELQSQKGLPINIRPVTGNADLALALCKELEFTSLIERGEWTLLKSMKDRFLQLLEGLNSPQLVGA